ncbi:MAG: hypothetical protein ACD_2C00141G0002 [uncultured bacterium (gcode 4)]|uniref:Gcp-like domain-containing protein n=1 Tax=uncultured bacterium (gcode 4) TaxID=1234023 RepID=K2H163_9BACT|nr:MAG: hypothetical protein ACD_2C00141G0002 [uncultured bacterium (gcode 4)]
MKIFVDTISPKWRIILYEDGKIIKEKEIEILGSEYSLFLDEFMNFLDESRISVKDVKKLTVVNGPGWFTWTRIIALIANTIRFVHNIPLGSIDYFSLMEKSGFDYPMMIRANRTECLLKQDRESDPVIVAKTDVAPWEYSWIWDELDFENRKVSIKWISDYSRLIENLDTVPDTEKIEPYYIKKPNIT